MSAMGQEDAPPAFERAGEGGQSEEIDLFDPVHMAPKAVRVRVEFIEMPHTSATKLLMEEKSVSADATALRMKLQGLVEKGEANVLETQVVMARSGQKATVESIHELIYPTEFNPVTFEQTKEDMEKLVAKGFTFNPATPSTFETRNVGNTLEVEPTISVEAKLIDIRIVPELMWHTGDRVWYDGKDSLGNPFQLKMPDFYVVRLNTSMTCVDGQYFMAGVLSPKNDKGELNQNRKVMVFVKCDILHSIP
jgi:Flp pilus assembly secretin CpaC